MKVAPVKFIRVFSLYLISTVVIYGLAGFLLLPVFVKNQLIEQSVELLKSRLNIEKIYFNPFTFYLKIEQLKMTELNSDKIKLAIDSVETNLEPSQLPFSTVELDTLFIKNLYLQINVADQKVLNWPTTFSASADQTEETGKNKWILKINHLLLEHSSLKISEIQSKQQEVVLDLSPLDIEIKNISTQEQADKAADTLISFALANQGKVQISGSIQPQPLAVDLRIIIERAPIDYLNSFLQKKSYLRLKKGHLSVDVRIIFKNSKTVILGQSNLDHFVVQNTRHGSQIASWEQIRIENFDFKYPENYLDVKSIQLKKLNTQLTLFKAGMTNWQNLFKTIKYQKQIPTKSEKKILKDNKNIFQYTLQEIKIENSFLKFHDQEIKPEFKTSVNRVQGYIGPVSSAHDTKTQIDLKGQIESFGRFTTQGFYIHKKEKPTLNLDMQFKNIEMTTFSPYAGRFAGYEIQKGKLYLDLNYKLKNNLIRGDNKIRLDQFTLGQKVESDEALNLPLKLALALIKDRDGQIKLTLPVEGDVSKPQFTYSHLVWAALKNALINVVAAPFNFLAGLGSTKQAEFIQFKSLDSILNENEQTKLQNIAQALQEKPDLQIELQSFYHANELAAYNQLHTPEESINKAKKLANQRALSVQQKLIEQKLSADKIFILSPKQIDNPETLHGLQIILKVD